MKNNELDDLFSDEPIEEVKLDLNQIRTHISKYSNEKLCDMIVCDRYFGLEEKFSPMCMEELGKRRASGDPFNFENYIEQAEKELPVLDFSIPDIQTVLKQVINGKFGRK